MSSKVKNFYEILGVSKTATEKEIRSAYKKLAVIKHPDKKGGNSEEFAQLHEAYEVLNDPEKRKIYDQYGSQYKQVLQQQQQQHQHAGMHFNPFDFMFPNMFEFNQKPQNMPPTIVLNLELTFDEAFHGCSNKSVKIPRCDVLCSSCDGQGGKNASTCTDCNGCGVRQMKNVEIKGGFHHITVNMVQCNNCNGNGKIFSNADKCTTCGGCGIKQQNRTIYVNIPQYTLNGHILNISGMGHQSKSNIQGNVQIQCQVKPHPKLSMLKFDNSNKTHLFTTHTFKLAQLITGCEITMETTYNNSISITIPGRTSNIQPNNVLCVQLEKESCNLYIKCCVELPTNESDWNHLAVIVEQMKQQNENSLQKTMNFNIVSPELARQILSCAKHL